MLPSQILVVEDDPGLRRLFCRQLERAGYEPLTAADGQEALEKCELLKPALILIDLHLGRMNGVTVYRRLHENPATRGIPAILYTGMLMPGDLLDVASRELDCGEIWQKSEDFAPLLERIRASLDGRVRRRGAPRTRGHEKRTLHFGPLTVDLIERSARLGARKLPRMPGRRFDLFLALLRCKNPVSAETLNAVVWNGGDLRKVHVTVMRLREDLKNVRSIRIRTTKQGYELSLDSRKR